MSASPASAIGVRVHYDFASSLCFIAHRAMQRLSGDLAARGIALEWSPLDLTRLTGWRRGDAMDASRRENVMRVSRELSVPLMMPGVWLDSRAAHAVALSLPRERAETWREAVFTSIYQAGRADPSRLVADLARELGIDASPEVVSAGLAELERRTREAAEQGVAGLPTFMLGEFPIAGIQADDTMLAMLSRFAARQREAAA